MIWQISKNTGFKHSHSCKQRNVTRGSTLDKFKPQHKTTSKSRAFFSLLRHPSHPLSLPPSLLPAFLPSLFPLFLCVFASSREPISPSPHLPISPSPHLPISPSPTLPSCLPAFLIPQSSSPHLEPQSPPLSPHTSHSALLSSLHPCPSVFIRGCLLSLSNPTLFHSQPRQQPPTSRHPTWPTDPVSFAAKRPPAAMGAS